MRRIFIGVLVLVLSACSSVPRDDAYRDIVRYQSQPWSVGDPISFRFLEQWRVSFSWFKGSWPLEACRFAANPFSRISGFPSFAGEAYSPMWEWRGTLISPTLAIKDKAKARILLGGPLDAPYDQWSLGVSSRGFTGFQPYCSAYFQESFTGVGIYIVRRDAGDAKERWGKDVQAVQINGFTWLKGVYGPSDFPVDSKKYGLSPAAEIHILPIPETDYWMVFEFNASKKFSSQERPVAYKESERQFHEIVASVKLEKIKPLVRQQDVVVTQKCWRSQPGSTWECPLDETSFIAH